MTVTRGALDTSAFYEIRKQGNVSFGYIELSTFGTDTAKQVEIALEMFKKKNIQTLVIDLRDNGGGYLTAATDILDLFFTSDEVIYQMKEKIVQQKNIMQNQIKNMNLKMVIFL